MFNRSYAGTLGEDDIKRAIAIGLVMAWGCEACEAWVILLNWDDVHHFRFKVKGADEVGSYKKVSMRVVKRNALYSKLDIMPWHSNVAGIVSIIPREQETENFDMHNTIMRKMKQRDAGGAFILSLTPVRDLVRALHEVGAR